MRPAGNPHHGPGDNHDTEEHPIYISINLDADNPDDILYTCDSRTDDGEFDDRSYLDVCRAIAKRWPAAYEQVADECADTWTDAHADEIAAIVERIHARRRRTPGDGDTP